MTRACCACGHGWMAGCVIQLPDSTPPALPHIICLRAQLLYSCGVMQGTKKKRWRAPRSREHEATRRHGWSGCARTATVDRSPLDRPLPRETRTGETQRARTLRTRTHAHTHAHTHTRTHAHTHTRTHHRLECVSGSGCERRHRRSLCCRRTWEGAHAPGDGRHRPLIGAGTPFAAV